MKRMLALLLTLCFFSSVKADHVTGGEMYYSFRGVTGTEYNYSIVLKLFTDCDSRRRVDDIITISVFSRYSGAFVRNVVVSKTNLENLNLTNPDPCITNPPTVCYQVSYFNVDLSLPGSTDGYVLTSQVNYRVNSLANLYSGYSNIGASYSAEIPGTSPLAGAPGNNSAVFTGSDLVVICEDHSFNYSFGAVDADGDKLVYSFCDAHNTGASGGGNIQNPTPPPYSSLPYGPLFSGTAPLGSKVKINSETGLITGVAPSEGKYVVTVCVQEIRNNVVIATQRKDIQIKIAPCSIAEASILPEYLLCKDTKTINLVNYSNSPLINAYQWKIEDASNTILLNSTEPEVNYTFDNIGTYTVRLYINPGQACSDSAAAPVRVYPGFEPAIDFTGICAKKPTFFKDATTSVYGNVNSWQWEFGRPGAANNTSTDKNPSYTYDANGNSNVMLIVGDDVGCKDTTYTQVAIVDKPPITLPFKDTLICIRDRVQLLASGSGNLSWGPTGSVDGSIPNPVVSPDATTSYIVNLNDNGCTNSDSLRVRVVDRVTLNPMNDTTICTSDTIRLRIESDGLQYVWTSPGEVLNPSFKNPLAVTGNNTIYTVRAIIGGCSATGNILVNVAPYPVAIAGADTTICFNTSAQLNSSNNGDSFVWSPATSLNNPQLANPFASPRISTSYVLSAYDSRSACPKPGRDTVTVTVMPDINAFAGNDTSVIIAQPLNFQATGGARYLWVPSTSLSAVDVDNPVGTYTTTSTGIQYKVLVYDSYNCVDSAYIKVKVFSSGPTVFVPNAFSPNSDGVNDDLKPIPVGILKIDYFYIYNRWGQLVYSGTDTEVGWDGTTAGKVQIP
ncbi:MAG: gliding motility-associated C-terminal domain-containing protein, partial [Chitinophagaceae bacterium]|nr:gliding motility-associated C-terminal domain-containing protein [Chitinophagaceae bacterium]